MIRILIADDHTLVRAGLRALLEDIGDVTVIAEAADGRQAFELAELHRPDIVLMDIAMSGLNGLEAAERIINAQPHSKVIILSMHSLGEYVTRALEVGVSGYLIKDSAALELELAVRAVCRGEKFLSPAVSTYLVDRFRAERSGQLCKLPVLTPRQREVLQLIAEGHSTKEIAQIMGTSTKTAESHRTQLMRRLNIHDIAGLVRYAIRTGLVSPES